MTTSTDPSHMDEKQAPPNPRNPALATIPLSPQRPKEKKSSIPIPAAAPDDPNNPRTRIRVGIAAMDKKARSKPMAEILSRLDENLFHVIFFGDDIILNQPIDLWPVCDVLIAFYSNGKFIWGVMNQVIF